MIGCSRRPPRDSRIVLLPDPSPGRPGRLVFHLPPGGGGRLFGRGGIGRVPWLPRMGLGRSPGVGQVNKLQQLRRVFLINLQHSNDGDNSWEGFVDIFTHDGDGNRKEKIRYMYLLVVIVLETCYSIAPDELNPPTYQLHRARLPDPSMALESRAPGLRPGICCCRRRRRPRHCRPIKCRKGGRQRGPFS